MNTDEIELNDHVVLQITTDNEGRKYHNIKFKRLTKAVICRDGKNTVVLGYPRIVYREGNSTFGDEIYMQFWIITENGEYDANSPYSNFEYYFKDKEGIEFLELVVKYIQSLN